MNRRRWRGSPVLDHRRRGVLTGMLLLGLAALTWVFFKGFGPAGLLFAAPLWGIALALPVLAVASAFKHRARLAATAAVEGRLFQYKGRWMAVAEDEADERWLRAEHVRQVVPGLPSDARLLHHLGEAGCRRFHGDASTGGMSANALYVHDAALLQLLARARQAGTIRFKVWVEREVQRPGALRRQRRAAPASPARDVTH